jgi:hypothetical protein
VRRKDRKLLLEPPVGDSVSSGQNQLQSVEIAASPSDFIEKEEEAWRQALLTAAMRKMRQRTSARNFAIYIALIGEESSPEELAEKYGMKRNAVDQVKARCQAALLEEARLLHQAWKELC